MKVKTESRRLILAASPGIFCLRWPSPSIIIIIINERLENVESKSHKLVLIEARGQEENSEEAKINNVNKTFTRSIMRTSLVFLCEIEMFYIF